MQYIPILDSGITGGAFPKEAGALKYITYSKQAGRIIKLNSISECQVFFKTDIIQRQKIIHDYFNKQDKETFTMDTKHDDGNDVDLFSVSNKNKSLPPAKRSKTSIQKENKMVSTFINNNINDQYNSNNDPKFTFSNPLAFLGGDEVGKDDQMKKESSLHSKSKSMSYCSWYYNDTIQQSGLLDLKDEDQIKISLNSNQDAFDISSLHTHKVYQEEILKNTIYIWEHVICRVLSLCPKAVLIIIADNNNTNNSLELVRKLSSISHLCKRTDEKLCLDTKQQHRNSLLAIASLIGSRKIVWKS